MARFCEKCNQEIGFFSKKTVALPDGTMVTVCKTCAAQLPRAQTNKRRTEAQANGNDVAALAELESAHSKDPCSVIVLSELGLLSLRMAEASEGRRRDEHLSRAGNSFRSLLLQRLDESSPIRKAEVFYYLAVVSERQGDVRKAIPMLERALAADGSLEKAKTLLAALRP